jgi:sigma54-dependent transcription regulator
LFLAEISTLGLDEATLLRALEEKSSLSLNAEPNNR